MSKPIYTNAAVAKLTAPITATDLAIVVDDATNFPTPLAGESFWMTLVGNVSQATEIVECTARIGTGFTIVRGQQGTLAQAFNTGDQAYHALTASDAARFRDAMYYYLGTHASDPSEDNYGAPLVMGMLYFNSTVGQQREYNGTYWQQFGTTLSVAGIAESQWDAHPAVLAGGAIVWPSDDGDDAPAYSVDNVFTVYVDGERLLNADVSGVDQGFNTADVGGLTQITLVDAVTQPFRLSITQAVVDTGDHLDRTEQNASTWGALGSQADIDNGQAGKLADGATVKSYADAGDASTTSAAAAYSDQVLVDAKAYTEEQILVGPKIYSIREADAETILQAGVHTRVDFGRLTAEAGLTYDVALGMLVQQAGAYRISGSLGFRIAYEGDTILSATIVLGSDPNSLYTWRQSALNSAVGDGLEFHTVQFNRLVRCEVGDYINIYARNTEQNDTLTPSGNYTFLDINYVGNAQL